MKTKTITVTAYKIQTAETSTADIDIQNEIISALEEQNSLGKRFMRHNELDDLKEGDLISLYEDEKNQWLFGSFVRIKEGELAQILKEQMGQNSLSLNDIAVQTDEKVEGAIKDYSYFLFSKGMLLYTGGVSLKSFQIYINWLIGKGMDFRFNPIIQEQNQIPLSEIKTVEITDLGLNITNEIKDIEKGTFTTITKNINNIARALLEQLLSESKDLNTIMAEDILSVNIQFKIKTPKKAEEEKKKALTALLKSVDNEDIIITAKNGQKIRGTSFTLKKAFKVELTSKGFPIEEHVKREMIVFSKGE